VPSSISTRARDRPAQHVAGEHVLAK